MRLDNNSFRLAESMPAMDAVFLAWNYIGNRDAKRMIFHYLTTTARAAVAKADVVLCNTFEELEPDIVAPYSPASILPIGPLRTWQRLTSEAPAGHFWRADDKACLSFLDAQPYGSVVYVAFGSLMVMSPAQLQELALALLASARPFLWVFTDLLPHHERSKVVEWAPQECVLAHPAIGCFLTHCGWNSTLEGVRHGVPLLCWPYFTDQFTNQAYICDMWRVGLRIVPNNSDGIVTKERIMERLESLMCDSGVKERMKRLKDLAERSMGTEGQSLKNLDTFMESMRK